MRVRIIGTGIVGLALEHRLQLRHPRCRIYLFEKERRSAGKKVEVESAGSSLKLCRLAEGSADVYPRFGPTMEWDTAAAQAVVEGAGQRVTARGGSAPLLYNKEDLLNPWFLVE